MLLLFISYPASQTMGIDIVERVVFGKIAHRYFGHWNCLHSKRRTYTSLIVQPILALTPMLGVLEDFSLPSKSNIWRWVNFLVCALSSKISNITLSMTYVVPYPFTEKKFIFMGCLWSWMKDVDFHCVRFFHRTLRLINNATVLGEREILFLDVIVFVRKF